MNRETELVLCLNQLMQLRNTDYAFFDSKLRLLLDDYQQNCVEPALKHVIGKTVLANPPPSSLRRKP